MAFLQQIRDFNSDGRPELLVISISGGKLQFELYRAENGEAQQIASESADPGFGDPVEGITYSGTQECFVKDNGTSVDIGIAGYYSGMSGEMQCRKQGWLSPFIQLTVTEQ